jgi:peptidoglycan/LPS O-acetylase OafA/YrhL
MQGQITLSKKKGIISFYLILMLVAAMLFLGIIFLKGFESPFSDRCKRNSRILNKSRI